LSQINAHIVKKLLKNVSPSGVLKKLPKENYRPVGENSPESGHPGFQLVRQLSGRFRLLGTLPFPAAPRSGHSAFKSSNSLKLTWGQCYERYFWRFRPIFGEQIGEVC
jgi:hypothetical protein